MRVGGAAARAAAAVGLPASPDARSIAKTHRAVSRWFSNDSSQSRIAPLRTFMQSSSRTQCTSSLRSPWQDLDMAEGARSSGSGAACGEFAGEAQRAR